MLAYKYVCVGKGILLMSKEFPSLASRHGSTSVLGLLPGIHQNAEVDPWDWPVIVTLY